MAHWTEQLFVEQADVYADIFAERFEAAEGEVEQSLALLDDHAALDPDRVLDVACGVGRHALAFAERGCAVDGIDISGPFVEEARERARDRGLDDRVQFHEEDMRDLDGWTGEYDLITSYWNSLGYYDRETDEAVLASLRSLLADGGILLVQSSNRARFLSDFESADVTEGDGRLHAVRRDYDVETGRFHTRLDWFEATEGGYAFRDTLEWENRIYAPPVFRSMCERAGFESVAFYGGLDGSELDPESTDVITLAR